MGYIIIIAIIFIIPMVGMWKIFEKANKPGWAAIIPIYNFIILLEIIGKPWWWLFLCLIPYLNLIWIIRAFNLLAKSFGKSEGFTIGLVFLPPIFFLILGFGGSQYSKPAMLRTLIKEEKRKQETYNQETFKQVTLKQESSNQESSREEISKDDCLYDILSINDKFYSLEEITRELKNGNYFVNKQSKIILSNGEPILLKDYKYFNKLKEFFPPEFN